MLGASIAMSGLALLAGGALTFASVPARADADMAPTDRHEIPAFVLQRVELAIGENRPVQAAASPASAADTANTGAIR
jgi:hypothetical protein